MHRRHSSPSLQVIACVWREGRGEGTVQLSPIDLLQPEPAGRVGREVRGPGEHTQIRGDTRALTLNHYVTGTDTQDLNTHTKTPTDSYTPKKKQKKGQLSLESAHASFLRGHTHISHTPHGAVILSPTSSRPVLFLCKRSFCFINTELLVSRICHVRDAAISLSVQLGLVWSLGRIRTTSAGGILSAREALDFTAAKPRSQQADEADT